MQPLSPMHLDYELSERDFVHGWLKVYQPPTLLVFSASSLAALAFLAIFVWQVMRQGLAHGAPWLLVGAVLGLPAFFLFRFEQRSKKVAKQAYQGSATVQGRLSVDLSEEVMEFSGMDFRLKTNWSQVLGFSEDRRVFVVQHRSQAPTTQPFSWHIVPKRNLSADEISQFRQYLQRNVRSRPHVRK
jgi:hypothetical protein